MSKRTPAFPNKYFKTQDEVLDFMFKHRVDGQEAQRLKKQMDKEAKRAQIPEPKII